MKNIYKLITLFFFIFTAFVSAQTGKLAGVVIDGEFNDPLPFANILIKGTTTGTTSDFDGIYGFELEEGTYNIIFSFAGYETKEVSDVSIKAGHVFGIDVTLITNSLETITSSIGKNTEAEVLNTHKKSVSLIDGLSGQRIKKTGESNLGSAIKGVPGIDSDRNTIQMDFFPNRK